MVVCNLKNIKKREGWASSEILVSLRLEAYQYKSGDEGAKLRPEMKGGTITVQ